MQRQCSECKTIKPISSFRKRKRGKDGYSSKCTECQKIYDKQWYQKNPQRRKNILVCNKNADKRNREIVRDFLLDHSCVDCGESDIVVLEFDHVRSKKINSIGYLLTNARSEQSLRSEMEKCEVRCANCHRRKTSRENNSWRQVEGSTPSTGSNDDEYIDWGEIKTTICCTNNPHFGG